MAQPKKPPKTKSLQCAAYKRSPLGQMTHTACKRGDGKGYFMQTEVTSKWRVATLVSDKTDFKTKAIILQGFPGSSVLKNLPVNSRDKGSVPDPGRSHSLRSNWGRAPQLLSLRAATTEARRLQRPGSEASEATSGRRLCPATGEKPAQQRRPSTDRK